ncbi:hypothetical protein [Chryseobacterium luquanense]|uniref:DUF4249 family protein n=1 Tax=Chryseobacterium luquanense TaxID=2983766 RepID=A0ABT3XY17_9FLAO|nr:hypothetical protein [Chryseobacterium luquanense]MCX8530761.1 hypothetical protein [Chryseobacterium luquanense]
MKNIHYLIIAYFSVVSCIREAPLNPEADIEEFKIDGQFLSSSTIIDQANSKILIYLKLDAYQSGVSLSLNLSQGATIIPASGTLVKFDQPVFYTLQSESGENQKTY